MVYPKLRAFYENQLHRPLIYKNFKYSVMDMFSLPIVLHANNGYAPEGPSISSDMMKLYYHQKDNTNIHKIYLRYRTGITVGDVEENKEFVRVFPNPAESILHIIAADSHAACKVALYNVLGDLVLASDAAMLDISHLPRGLYVVAVVSEGIL